MGKQQLLMIVAGILITGITISVGFHVFQSYARQNHIDNMISDLNHLATKAHQYAARPVSMGGGSGDFRPETIQGSTDRVSGGPQGAVGFHSFFVSLPENLRENSYAIYEFDVSVDNVDHGGYHYHEHEWINTPHPQVIIKGTSKRYQEDGQPLVRYIAIRRDGKMNIGKTNFDHSDDEAIMRP